LTNSDSGDPLNLSECEEFKRLRKENRELKMAQEIPEMASTFFAREIK
jgi:hypothetical protein